MSVASRTVLQLAVALCFVFASNADTIANCTYDNIRGTWKFYEGERGFQDTLNCTSFVMSDAQTILDITLSFPNIASDSRGTQGTWTLIYNQGFEVIINGRRYFAFSNWNNCEATFPGWQHLDGSGDWSCWMGVRVSSPMKDAAKEKVAPKVSNTEGVFDYNQLYDGQKYVQHLNKHVKTWEAYDYEDYKSMTFNQIKRRMGHRLGHHGAKATGASEDVKRAAASLPSSFDWRNVNGQDFVSPIRNQGGCGSCYAFGSTAQMEARFRVFSNNTLQPVFSPQDIIGCSNYSQGCEGGFPYLTAGKYAADFGFVEESCNKYIGKDGPCTTNRWGPDACKRWYTSYWQYIGGFYGACSEAGMLLDLVANGPVAVSIEAYEDLLHYKGGIYIHNYTLHAEAAKVGFPHPFNPFEITNHIVLIVGYGKENGLKYWIVKNSWGTAWGEQGFFRIVRGIDNIAIESIAVTAFPLLPAEGVAKVST